MPTFPEKLSELDHATFDAGLVNAARNTRRRLEQENVQRGGNEDAAKAYASLRVPWWLEMKHDTPWTLRQYSEYAHERLSEALLRDHASHVDVRRDDVRRLLQHTAHEMVWDSVPLHVGYRDPETDVAYTADDILIRVREKLKWVVMCRYMEIGTDEDPLWNRSKVKRMTHKSRRVVDATQPQIAAARYLVGPDYNIKTTTGPIGEAIRTELPFFLSVDNRDARILSSDLRRRFQGTLATSDDQVPEQKRLHDMKKELTATVIDIWLQINPLADGVIAAMHEEGKPDPREASAIEVFDAYVEPHIDSGNQERLRALVPLIGYHTISAVAMEDMQTVGRALQVWTAIVRKVPDLPSRVIDLALIACRIALANDIEELRSLKLQMQ